MPRHFLQCRAGAASPGRSRPSEDYVSSLSRVRCHRYGWGRLWQLVIHIKMKGLEGSQSDSILNKFITQAIHALWYGREVIVTYEFKQVFTLEKRLYTCPYFVTLIDSQEEPQLCWKRCFKAKSFLMLFLCFYIFYLSLQFLCENSELGHYSVLCKLKAWEWATQPCLCAVCWNPRNLQFGHLRGDRFIFPPTYNWIWNSWPSLDTDGGGSSCGAQHSCFAEMLPGLLGHSSSFLPWSAGCCWMLCLPAHFLSRVWKNLLDMVCSQHQRSLCNTLVPAK